MKVKYRQSNNYGCISFAIANIFDDHRFLEELPTDAPVRMADLRGKMVSFLPELFIQEIFITSHKLLGGDRLIVQQSDIFRPIDDRQSLPGRRETLAVPFIVTIVNEKGNQHAIAVIWDLATDYYHVIDSNKEDIEVWAHVRYFVHRYHIVGVAQFGLWEGGDCGLIMQKKDLPHIFDTEE